MASIRRVQVRLPEKYQDLTPFISDLFKIFDLFDVRSDGSVFVDSLHYNELTGALTVDNADITNSDVGDGTTINDGAKVTTQKVLPMVNFGNISSVQSLDPISATAGPSTADLVIAAHTLHTDFGDIAYNSGSILGLALNTRYYVDVDDPNNLGGAVTYLSSASKPTVPANVGRYLVGSIVTPVSASTSNISAATSANPIEFTTTAAHGWSTTDTVDFALLPGDFAALNAGTYPITVTAPDKFTVAVDGTLFAAYTSGGTATRVVPDEFPDYGGGGGGSLP